MEQHLADVTQLYGLLWRVNHQIPPGAPDKEIHKILRRAVLYDAFLRGQRPDEHGNISVTIKMPCGSTIVYPDIDDVPMENIPCPCGDTTHWLVRYEDSWIGRN